jgi:hypothetical protein
VHLDTTHVPPHCSFQQSAIKVPRVSLAGQETFQVDSALILAKSLRGIGRSFQSIISGIIDGDLSVFGRFIEADAQLALPGGGGPAPVTDPAVANFVATTLVFPPGVDRTSVFDVREKTDPELYCSLDASASVASYHHACQVGSLLLCAGYDLEVSNAPLYKSLPFHVE